MRKLIRKILQKYDLAHRKPYGHDYPEIALDFHESITTIIKEWTDFHCITNDGGIPIDELSEEQKGLNQDKRWKVLFLFIYGENNQHISPHFPEITKLIQKWKDEITLVFFSRMEPDKHIPPHEGNNHGVLRVQLGIDIPQPEKTGLKVADKIVHLRNQELFIFDDTYTHEAWNHSNFHRTVLIIDIRKNYSYIYSILNKIEQNYIKKSDYVQSVLKKLKNT